MPFLSIILNNFEEMNGKHVLSKSLFLSGLQCRKKIWLLVHDPKLAVPVSGLRQRLMDQGLEVGILARRHYKKGILIDEPSYMPERAIIETQSALAAGAQIVFEGAFQADGIFVRADILMLRSDTTKYDIIEVKSSTRAKEEHIPDLAVQKYVAQAAGLNIGSCCLMHINTKCVWPDTAALFITDDMSEEVENYVQTVPAAASQFKEVIHSTKVPDIQIGMHCLWPYECAFKSFCWRDTPDFSILNLKKLSFEGKSELVQHGHLTLSSIPSDFPLSPTDREQIDFFSLNVPEIDWTGIAKEIETLEFPLYFLDFETDSQAIPRFEGTHPYEQIPFQYSLHIMSDRPLPDVFNALGVDMLAECGALNLLHKEYLHLDSTDPRPALAERLLEDIGETGTIIAYYAPFEKRVIKRLSEIQKQNFIRLQSLLKRFWDPLPVLRAYYLHPAFYGSYSLKSVLPVVAPGMSYDKLDVRDGVEAQVAWARMKSSKDKQERMKLEVDLKRYCGQDTLAMVKLYIHFMIGTIEGGNHAGSRVT